MSVHDNNMARVKQKSRWPQRARERKRRMEKIKYKLHMKKKRETNQTKRKGSKIERGEKCVSKRLERQLILSM